MPNAAYEVLFTTNAPQVEREIKKLHRQVGVPIVPTVDLSTLKALNAELDLKQRHLRQTIAYFKQNQIKASMELSMPALTPAALQKALPSAEIKKVAQQQAKQLHSALQAETEKAGPIEVEFKVLDPAGITAAKAQLANLIRGTKTFPRQGAELEQLTGLARRKGIALPGLEGIAKPSVAATREALVKGLEQAGDQAIAGFVKSLTAGNSTAKTAAERLGLAALKQIKNTLGIASPSREFMKIGLYAIQGLAQGIQKEGPEAVKSIQALGKLMDRAMKDAIRKVQAENAFKAPSQAIANSGANAGKDFSEKLADGITSGASKVIAAAKRLSTQLGAAMGGGGGHRPSSAIGAGKILSTRLGAAMGGGGVNRPNGGLGQPIVPDANLPGLSNSVLRSYKLRDEFGKIIGEIKGLYNQVNEIDTLINKTPINSRRFRSLQASAGFRQGEIERAQNIGQVERLRASSRFFEEGSLTRLNKELQALQIQASQIKPDTKEWNKYQTQIAGLGRYLNKIGEAARLISLNELSKSVPQASLTALSSKLEALRLQVKDLEPGTEPWRKVQNQINQTTLALERTNRAEQRSMLMARERSAPEGSVAQLQARIARRQMALERLTPETAKYSAFSRKNQQDELRIERITRKPLTMSERSGAAAGAVLYGGGLAGSPLSALGGLAGGVMGGIPGSFTGAAIGQTADQLMAAASASATYAASLSRLRIALAGVSGSFENYQANLKAINSISNTFGMSIDKVIRPYTKLQASVLAAGYSAQTTKDIFEGVTAASIATGGSAEDLEGSMRAVTQIFAKGTVQSEELVGQLSERIPGAFALFARFNNMSTASLKDALERGQVGLDNFIKFNKGLLETYGQSAREIAKGPEYAGQRLEAALKRLQGSVGGALAPIGAAFQEWATGAVNAFDQVIKKMQQYGLLSNQLSSGGIVEQVLSGQRSRKSVTEDIASLRKEIAQRKKEAQSSFLQGSLNAFDESWLAQMALIPSKNTEGVKSKEQRLATLSAAEASLKKLDDQIKNGAKEQALAAAEASKKELVSLAERYGELMSKRDEDLAQARKDYENDLQDLRKNHAQEMLRFEESIADERKSIELDIATTRRGIAADSEDMATQEQILLAKARGEDTTVLEKQQAFRKQVRTDREAVLRLEEDQITKQEKRQKDLDKLRKQNSEDINKRAEEHAKRVKSIGEEYTKNVSKLLTKAAVDAGQTLEKTTERITLQHIMLLMATQRVQAGLHPYKEANGQIAEEIRRVQDKLNQLGSDIKTFRPSSNPRTSTKPLGQGGPDLPDWVMAQAQNKPVPESEKMYPADSRQHAPSPSVEIERIRATERLQAETERQRLANERMASLKQSYDEILEPLNQAKRTASEQTALIRIQATLLHNGVNPALVESLAIAQQLGKKAEDKIAKEEEGYKLSLAKGDLSLDQYKRLTEFSAKLTDNLKTRLALSDQEIAIYKEEEAALRTNLDIAKRSVLSRATPGLQTKTAELMLEGFSDPGKASRFAKVLMDIEGDERIKSQFTSLGETLNSTLGNAIVNTTMDWSNFSGTLQDSVKTLQDAFKQLANAIINEMTRAFVNKTVGWLMQVAGFGATLMGGSANANTEGFTTDTGIDASRFSLGNQKAFKFANGGIVTGPTLGLIGEGRYNEAIIPMPNNRAVPVDLKGNVGSTYNSPISVVINNSSAGATTESQITGDQGNKLAGVLDKAVKQAILSEQRPGGLLYRQ